MTVELPLDLPSEPVRRPGPDVPANARLAMRGGPLIWADGLLHYGSPAAQTFPTGAVGRRGVGWCGNTDRRVVWCKGARGVGRCWTAASIAWALAARGARR